MKSDGVPKVKVLRHDEESLSPRAAAERVFELLDVSKSGYLEESDLKTALILAGVLFEEKQVSMLLKQLDTSGRGRVSREDFVKFGMSRDEEIRKLFDDLDINSNRQISAEELVECTTQLGRRISLEQAKALVRRVDRSGDLELSLEEFRFLMLLLPLRASHSVADLFDHWEQSAVLDAGDATQYHSDLSSEHKSPLPVLLAGAIAGAVSRTVTAPFDRLKVLWQVGASALSTSPVSNRKLGRRSVLSGLRHIYTEGGCRGFFRGNLLNVVKIAPETAIKFYIFDSVHRLVRVPADGSVGDPTEIAFKRFACGAISGVIAQTAIYPLEVTKTRLALGRTGQYAGIVDCMRTVVQDGGYRALFRGLGASILGIIPYAGVDLAMYTWLKELYITMHPYREPGWMVLLGCGAFSSTCGQLASYPLQLVRTRLQSQGAPGVPYRYAGILDCLHQTIRSDGIIGCYRGLAPNFLKAVPAISISYVVFEKSRCYLENYSSMGHRQ